MVTRAHAIAVDAEYPEGTSSSRPRMIGITVTGMRRMIVPETVGVRILRKRDKRMEKRN